MVVSEQLECRSTCRNRVAAPTTAHPHSRTALTTFPERDVSTWITWRGGALRRRGPDRRRGDRTSPMRLDGTMTTDPASGPAVGELLRFEDVAVVRDDSVLLLDASGAVGAGEVLARTGANGAGKTTLLRVLAGRLEPTAGRVHVLGRIPDDRDRTFRTALAALIGPPQT